MNWYVNGGALSRMRTGSSQGSRDGFYAFQDGLINNKEWMTVHISLQLWRAEVEARSDERRPSSLHDVPMGLLPPNMPYDPSSKSDLGGHTFKEHLMEQQRAMLNDKPIANNMEYCNEQSGQIASTLRVPQLPQDFISSSYAVLQYVIVC